MDRAEMHEDIPNTRPIEESVAIAGWKEIPIIETEKSHEPLVPVGLFSDYDMILSSSVYADEHYNSPYAGGLDGSEVAVFMRLGVAERLKAAAALLPKGMHMMVMDAYRTLDVQQSLYDQYYDGLRHKYPEWSEQQLSDETQKYVSVPSSDPTCPSPHNTGASVDVVIVHIDDDIQAKVDAITEQARAAAPDDWETLYDLTIEKDQLLRRHAQMLEFGTRFDHGGEEAALGYYESIAKARDLTEAEDLALKNRRFLYAVMRHAGFEPYPDEWWHYNDPASQMGAKIGQYAHAEYGAVELSQENIDFARMRAAHHANTVRMSRGEQWAPPSGLEEHYAVARAAALRADPRTLHRMSETVAKIEPPTDTATD